MQSFHMTNNCHTYVQMGLIQELVPQINFQACLTVIQSVELHLSHCAQKVQHVCIGLIGFAFFMMLNLCVSCCILL